MIKEILQYVSLSLTPILVAFAILKGYFNDNGKQDKSIGEMEVACKLKHENIDGQITGIYSSLKLIKENHLKHIENDILALTIIKLEY